MRNYVGTCKGIFSYNLVYNFFDIAFAITKFSFCSALLNAFWHGNKSFLKGSFQNVSSPCNLSFSIQPTQGVKICFHLARCENPNFFNRVVLVSFVQHSCHTRVACVWHACCKTDQISVLCLLCFINSLISIEHLQHLLL